ncbi:MAG: SHIRT domain-containing protein [Erysipelotrichaceae bacterium]|nr:SHIRT domain-containing protein [Erysipelotrichaceae bacterium]
MFKSTKIILSFCLIFTLFTINAFAETKNLEGDLYLSKDNVSFDSTNDEPFKMKEPEKELYLGASLNTSKINEQLKEVAAKELGEFNKEELYQFINFLDIATEFTAEFTFDGVFNIDKVNESNVELRSYVKNGDSLNASTYDGMWKIARVEPNLDNKKIKVNFQLKSNYPIGDYPSFALLKIALEKEKDLFLTIKGIEVEDWAKHNTNYKISGTVNGSFLAVANYPNTQDPQNPITKKLEFNWTGVQETEGADSVSPNEIATTLKYERILRKVSYKFTTDSQIALPDAIKNRLPQVSEHPTREVVTPQNVDLSDYTDNVNRGVWKFESWNQNAFSIIDTDVEFVGKWKFEANPVTPPPVVTPIPSTPTPTPSVNNAKTSTVTNVKPASTSKPKLTCEDEGKVWNETKQMCVAKEVLVSKYAHKVPNTGSKSNILMSIVTILISVSGLFILKTKFKNKN